MQLEEEQRQHDDLITLDKSMLFFTQTLLLWTPAHHCQYNAIEGLWSMLKALFNPFEVNIDITQGQGEHLRYMERITHIANSLTFGELDYLFARSARTAEQEYIRDLWEQTDNGRDLSPFKNDVVMEWKIYQPPSAAAQEAAAQEAAAQEAAAQEAAAQEAAEPARVARAVVNAHDGRSERQQQRPRRRRRMGDDDESDDDDFEVLQRWRQQQQQQQQQQTADDSDEELRHEQQQEDQQQPQQQELHDQPRPQREEGGNGEALEEQGDNGPAEVEVDPYHGLCQIDLNDPSVYNWNSPLGGDEGEARRRGVVITGIWCHNVDTEIAPIPIKDIDLLDGCDDLIRSILGERRLHDNCHVNWRE